MGRARWPIRLRFGQLTEGDGRQKECVDYRGKWHVRNHEKIAMFHTVCIDTHATIIDVTWVMNEFGE